MRFRRSFFIILLIVFVVSMALALIACTGEKEVAELSKDEGGLYKQIMLIGPITYTVGHFDINDYSLILTKKDDTTEQIPFAADMVSAEDFAKFCEVGQHQITVSYVGLSTTVTFTVKDMVYVSLTVFGPSNIAPGKFDCKDYSVTLTSDSGEKTTVQLTADMLDNDDVAKLNTVGSYSITVSCCGVSGTFQITVMMPFKVGVLYADSVASTVGNTYAHHQGIIAAQEALGLKDSQIVIKDSLPDDRTDRINAAIEELIAEGCNMIIGTSFGYMECMKTFAEKYPEIVFSHATGYLDTYGEGQNNNMNNYFGRIYQVRYLAGLVAGLTTKTNNIGYVSARGTDTAECTSGVNAFALGVQAVNPEAKVHVMILNSWYDPTNEKGFADTLIEDYNCDVITQHCDTEGPSSSAKEHNVYSIGYNSDMALAVADKGVERDPSVLTSVLWNWGAYYTEAIETAMKCFDEQGNFVSIDAWKEFGNYYGDYTDGLYELAPLSENCAEGTAEIVALVEEMMSKGTSEWDVFTNKALSFTKGGDGKYTVTRVDRQLKDNSGNDISKVTISNITGNMPYWIEGIVVHMN